jgi:transcriptional regulator with XRE-family HTH domain
VDTPPETQAPTDGLTESLAATVTSARLERGWSVNVLAQESGVSRAMIARIERGEVQPTAALLARLSGALGMTLSELIAHAEGAPDRLARYQRQPVWRDPETGYLRRAVSPAASVMLQLIEVELPPHARVSMPRESYLFIDQQIWILEGQMRFVEGDQTHDLEAGDCLQLGEPQTCVFVNPTHLTCRYLVALRKR